MAGVKETPRQKMIGMMYLVLTAMLALNVDSAVLERFELINSTLESQISTNVTRNDETIKSIAATVNKRGDREEELAVVNKAKLVRDKTKELVSYMDKVKNDIIEFTGGRDPETTFLVGAKDMDKMADYMIRQKRGVELQEKLNAYTTWLSTEIGKDFPALALDGKQDPFYSRIPNQRGKNFSELMFESVPTAGGVASLSQIEGQVLVYENEALSILGKKVGAEDLAFDKAVPMVLPESQLVVAGAKYKAKMFVAASASGVTPTMKLNGGDIPVDADGFGQVEFVAKAEKFDESGRQQKSFLAEITIGDKTFKDEIQYIVARPVIVIQSASVQALYRNCGNKLNVQVPALGAAYIPSFQVKGGSVNSSKGPEVVIVPTSASLDLSVYSSGTFIGTQTFRVKQIPKPEISLKAGGREVNLKTGLKQVPREITLDAVPDEDFATFLPDDARYRVTKWEVTLARGARGLETKQVTSRNADLSSFVSKARPGDRIVVEAKEVQRMNFKGDKENVSIGVSASIVTIPLTE